MKDNLMIFDGFLLIVAFAVTQQPQLNI